MSDDEEVIIGKSDLYNHLIKQGYSDFESFSPSLADFQHLPKNELLNIGLGLPSCDNFFVSSHNHQNIRNVLNSHLLLKDDVDLVEGFISNIIVEDAKSKWYHFACPAVSSLLLYALSNKKFIFYVSVGITCLITGYSSLKGYKEFVAHKENKAFQSHVGALQKLCLSVHKMLRFIRETEIISTREVPFHNIGVVMYNSLHLSHDEAKPACLKTSPSWKTLPHLRKYFANALEKVIHVFLFACDAFKACSPELSKMSMEYILKNAETSNDRQYSVKDLQTLVDNYLALQSEYLRWLAISFAPSTVGDILGFKNNSKRGIHKVVIEVQSEINCVYLGLSMQLNIHNISANLTQPLQSKNNDHSKNINKLQVEIHNIFLLMLSLLLRVRSLEDDLGNGSSDHLTKALNPTHKLSVIRDDFLSVLKCYDIICQQFIANRNTETHDQDLGFNSSTNTIDAAAISTGIEVGASDFNVYSPDEVFLAITGLKCDIQDDYLDDWYLESKPQIPKNLLTELSNTLSHRKKDFSEREKQALERQGLQDIESNSDSSNDEIELYKDRDVREHLQPKSKRNYNTTILDSENDNYQGSLFSDNLGEYFRIKSDSIDTKSENKNKSDVKSMDPLTSNLSRPTSSLANLVAIKSQLWNKMSEEHFSDTSEEC